MILICPACATGACDRCAGTVTRSRVTKPCSCRHGVTEAPPLLGRTTDPRELGGSITTAHPGAGGAMVDTRRALLVEDLEICSIDSPGTGAVMIAMLFSGRINQSDDHAAVLNIIGPDGAAAIVSEVLGLASRMGPAFELEFREALDLRLELSELWTAPPPDEPSPPAATPGPPVLP